MTGDRVYVTGKRISGKNDSIQREHICETPVLMLLPRSYEARICCHQHQHQHRKDDITYWKLMPDS